MRVEEEDQKILVNFDENESTNFSWKKLAVFMGPGFLMSIAYLDPGMNFGIIISLPAPRDMFHLSLKSLTNSETKCSIFKNLVRQKDRPLGPCELCKSVFPIEPAQL